MKVICILTYERTGSGWLSGIFDTEDSVSVHEIFSDDPLLWFMKCEQIFKKIYDNSFIIFGVLMIGLQIYGIINNLGMYK
jgi:hypothetical protein